MTRTEKKYAKIDEQMARFAAEPDGLRDFAEKIRPKYLFYSYKAKRAYCSACGESFEPTKGLKHNDMTVCPRCGATLKAKHESRIGKLNDIIWTVWAQNDGDDLLLHYYRTITDYSNDFRHPCVETSEQFRTLIDDKYHDFMWWHPQSRDGRKQPERWMKYAKRGIWWNSYSSNKWQPWAPYVFGDLNEAVKKSRLKYCPLDGLLKYTGLNDDGTIDGWSIDRWLSSYIKVPQIELLFKVGFKRLTYEAAGNGIEVNTSATNIKDALGITNRQVKQLLKLKDPTASEYRMIRDFDCSAEEARWLAKTGEKNGIGWIMKDLVKYAPLSRYIEYFGNNNLEDVRSYHDYIKWIVALNYDLKEWLFPKDFQQAHDRLMEIYYIEQDKSKNEQIALVADASDLDFQYNGLFVRPAMSAEELRNEGQTLHHCVATYADRMARGETLIMFVRRENEPDTPFYTMEVKNNEIVQLRGSHNCAPTPEVAEFREEFEKMLKAPKTKKIAA